jgi:hypothetical protein
VIELVKTDVKNADNAAAVASQRAAGVNAEMFAGLLVVAVMGVAAKTQRISDFAAMNHQYATDAPQ